MLIEILGGIALTIGLIIGTANLFYWLVFVGTSLLTKNKESGKLVGKTFIEVYLLTTISGSFIGWGIALAFVIG